MLLVAPIASGKPAGRSPGVGYLRPIESMQTVTGEDQDVVLAGLDFDAVGVAGAEPTLGYRRDGVAVAFDLVLAIDDVSMGLQVRSTLDINLVPITKPDDRLVDGRVSITDLDR